jgi:hypothetical protein
MVETFASFHWKKYIQYTCQAKNLPVFEIISYAKNVFLNNFIASDFPETNVKGFHEKINA